MSFIDAIAAQAVKAALPFFPDRVTFYRPSRSGDTVGGSSNTPVATTPPSIPCVYDPASGSEREQAGKPVSGNAYMLTIPATYGSSLVDLDSRCSAVVAANVTTGQPARTFQIKSIGRVCGAIIQLLVTIEE